MSGSVSTRTANQQAERVTASGQLRLPSCWSAEPVKSSVSSSPSTVAFRRSSRSPSARLEHVARLARAVLELGEAGAHAALGVVDRLRHRLAQAVGAEPLAQLEQPLGAGAVGGELGAQVGAALGGLAHLRRRARSIASSSSRRGAITTPSSSSVVRVGGHRARRRAADVGVVGAAGGEAEQLAAVEHRRDDRDVGQVGAAGERVVEHPRRAVARGPRPRPRRPRRASRRGAPGCARPA